MHTQTLRRIATLGLAGLALAFSAAGATTKTANAPTMTPFGITLVDVTTGNPGSVLLLWRRLGDADGKPLYTFDADGTAGKSTCIADCAREFPPYQAAKGAMAFGPWSIVARKGGIRQWAYEGRPLYRYSGADPLPAKARGFGTNADAQRKATAEATDPASKVNSPKDGWRRAAFSAGTSAAPPEFELKSSATANGYAWVVASTGQALYVFKAAPKQPADWSPAYAAALASDVGDFSITVRADGKRQWAYKHKPLYTYKDDYAPDDINGLAAQKDMQVAYAYRDYMPASLAIRVLPYRGPIMVTVQGMTVYVQTRNHNQYGGREARGGYRYDYAEAKAVGTQACVAECLKRWKPVVAPANAKASGFWEVDTRTDGTRQWAYKGAALYTYAADKSMGDNKGNNLHEIVYGNGNNENMVKLSGGDANGASGAGFYWHVVPFFN